MKKLILVLMVLFAIAGMAIADDGTVTVSSSTVNGRDMEVFTFAFVANSTGVVPATSTTVTTCQSHTCYPYDRAGYILKVTAKPGSPAPASNWDITIVDDITGADLLGGEGANLSNTVSTEIAPKLRNAYGWNMATTSFTVNWSNVTNNLAAGTIYVYVAY